MLSPLIDHTSRSCRRYISSLLCYYVSSSVVPQQSSGSLAPPLYTTTFQHQQRQPQRQTQRSYWTTPATTPCSSWPALSVSSRGRSLERNLLTRRFLGSKVGSGGPPGEIEIDNDQQAIPNVNVERLRETMTKIRLWLGYETYNINLYLTNDHIMREVNLQSRGIDRATDILSFPSLEAEKPGTLKDPEVDHPEYYIMGEMLVDVDYVIRQIKEDQKDLLEEQDSDDFDYDQRGVAMAMAPITDPELRIHMLLVHGMLHLVGYDHEEDADYEDMVTKEDELLKHLNLVS